MSPHDALPVAAISGHFRTDAGSVEYLEGAGKTVVTATDRRIHLIGLGTEGAAEVGVRASMTATQARRLASLLQSHAAQLDAERGVEVFAGP